MIVNAYRDGTKVIPNRPARVPAYMVPGSCGSIARVVIANADRPEFTALQFAPASVLLVTPLSIFE
jgi:hypothetical protein